MGKRKRRFAFSSAAAMEAHASALGGIANSHQRCSDSAIPQPKLSFVSLIAAATPPPLSQLLFQLRCRRKKGSGGSRGAAQARFQPCFMKKGKSAAFSFKNIRRLKHCLTSPARRRKLHQRASPVLGEITNSRKRSNTVISQPKPRVQRAGSFSVSSRGSAQALFQPCFMKK